MIVATYRRVLHYQEGRCMSLEEEEEQWLVRSKAKEFCRQRRKRWLVERIMYFLERGRIVAGWEEGQEVSSGKKKKRWVVRRKRCGGQKRLRRIVAGKVKVVWPGNRKEIGQSVFK